MTETVNAVERHIVLLTELFEPAIGSLIVHWTTVPLDEQPVTKYVDGNLVITTTLTSITYPLEQVRKYTYTSQTDGFVSLKTIGVTFSADGEALTFNNLKPQTDIAVYNATGQLLLKQASSESGSATISCSHMPVGVYVVKVNGATYKISKR